MCRAEVFLGSEKELVDTVDGLDRAIAVLKKNLSLLQSGNYANILGTVASSLKKVVEASWVNSHQKSVLTSLLQANDGQWELLQTTDAVLLDSYFRRFADTYLGINLTSRLLRAQQVTRN